MTTIKTSSRLDRVKPSITMAVTGKAKLMKAQGVDVVSFGAGEPDFDTPEHIKDAARKGLDTGVAKYTVVKGITALREAIAQETKQCCGLDVGIDDIIVSNGAKQGLFNLFLAMLDEGDEVVIPAPYWVSYPDMVRLAGGEPVSVLTSADNGFAMSAEQLDAACTERTRAVVLNSPSNPTGSIYTRAQLEALLEVVVRRDLLVVSDDIYRSLVYGDAKYTPFASLSPEAAARTILIDGVSKTYAMTGWRIGWAVGPRVLIDGMAKIQSQSTSGASHIAQVAATAALTGSRECVEEMRKSFDERRLLITKLLRDIPGVECREPQGAFYAFPDISSFIGKKAPDGSSLGDDVALATYLLDAAKVAVVPGTGFGSPGYLRLSYACSAEDIQRGLARIKEALAKLT